LRATRRSSASSKARRASHSTSAASRAAFRRRSRALRARDGGCRFPGCDRTRFCDGHHIEHWASGGETKLKNFVALRIHKLNREAGLEIGPETGRCQWHGEPTDYSQAIQAMQFLETRAVT
jgi:hypothetical protein